MIKIILLLFTMYITSLLNENTIVDLTKHFFFLNIEIIWVLNPLV